MYCSTIIPTIGRSTLARAVQSVVDQSLPDGEFEIVVVNDSGSPLAEADWQSLPCVRVVTTNRRERSVARNTGAALAQGDFLHFLDDDDWLLPNALQALQQRAATTQADWVYGATQLVDRSGAPLLQLQHGLDGNCFVQVMAGEWIPLQSSLIRSTAFSRAGGFNPRITGPEDVDLCRRILLNGDAAGTDAVVAAVGMGEEGSTTDYANHARASRGAREEILDQEGVFRRLAASATGPEWHGRMVRIYLTSALWNLQRAWFLRGLGRAGYAFYGLLRSLPFLLSGTFWQAVAHSYQSDTFARAAAGSDAAAQSHGRPDGALHNQIEST